MNESNSKNPADSRRRRRVNNPVMGLLARLGQTELTSEDGDAVSRAVPAFNAMHHHNDETRLIAASSNSSARIESHPHLRERQQQQQNENNNNDLPITYDYDSHQQTLFTATRSTRTRCHQREPSSPAPPSIIIAFDRSKRMRWKQQKSNLRKAYLLPVCLLQLVMYFFLLIHRQQPTTILANEIISHHSANYYSQDKTNLQPKMVVVSHQQQQHHQTTTATRMNINESPKRQRHHHHHELFIANDMMNDSGHHEEHQTRQQPPTQVEESPRLKSDDRDENVDSHQHLHHRNQHQDYHHEQQQQHRQPVIKHSGQTMSNNGSVRPPLCDDCLAIPLVAIMGGKQVNGFIIQPAARLHSKNRLSPPLENYPNNVQSRPPAKHEDRLYQQQIEYTTTAAAATHPSYTTTTPMPAYPLLPFEPQSDEKCPMTGPLTVCDQIGSYPADAILHRLDVAKKQLDKSYFNIESFFSDERDHLSEPFENEMWTPPPPPSTTHKPPPDDTRPVLLVDHHPPPVINGYDCEQHEPQQQQRHTTLRPFVIHLKSSPPATTKSTAQKHYNRTRLTLISSPSTAPLSNNNNNRFGPTGGNAANANIDLQRGERGYILEKDSQAGQKQQRPARLAAAAVAISQQSGIVSDAELHFRGQPNTRRQQQEGGLQLRRPSTANNDHQQFKKKRKRHQQQQPQHEQLIEDRGAGLLVTVHNNDDNNQQQPFFDDPKLLRDSSGSHSVENELPINEKVERTEPLLQQQQQQHAKPNEFLNLVERRAITFVPPPPPPHPQPSSGAQRERINLNSNQYQQQQRPLVVVRSNVNSNQKDDDDDNHQKSMPYTNAGEQLSPPTNPNGPDLRQQHDDREGKFQPSLHVSEAKATFALAHRSQQQNDRMIAADQDEQLAMSRRTSSGHRDHSRRPASSTNKNRNATATNDMVAPTLSSAASSQLAGGRRQRIQQTNAAPTLNESAKLVANSTAEANSTLFKPTTNRQTVGYTHSDDEKDNKRRPRRHRRQATNVGVDSSSREVGDVSTTGQDETSRNTAADQSDPERIANSGPSNPSTSNNAAAVDDDGGAENNDDASNTLEAQPEPVCRSKSIYISPKVALNDKKQWKYVVNARERNPKIQQIIRVDICQNPFGPCSEQVIVPFGFTSQCKQKYAKKKLLALDAQSGLLEVDTFFIPSCCVCQLISETRSPTTPLEANNSPELPMAMANGDENTGDRDSSTNPSSNSGVDSSR